MGMVADFQMHLQDHGIIDGSSDWPSVQRIVHDGSARLVILTEDGGLEPETPSPEGLGDSATEEPAVQVRVRGAKGEGPEALAQITEIRNAMHGLLRQQVGYTVYDRIKAQSQAIYIGLDAKDRPEFTLSFRGRKALYFISA